jgi:hypothetical protein
MDFFFSHQYREGHEPIGMIILEKSPKDSPYSLIYASERIFSYLKITRVTYLQLVADTFLIDSILERAGIPFPVFEQFIQDGQITLEINDKADTGKEQISMTRVVYDSDDRTVYEISVYEALPPVVQLIPQDGIFVRTFGHFDVFVNGNPIVFSSSKEKELLALLIDRNGGTLSTSDAISYLWEDEEANERVANRYRKLAMNLKNTLKKYGIDHILVNNHGIRSIDVNALTCDYYEMLNGNQKYQQMFHNVYMEDYSWAEDTLATLWQYS